MTREEAIQKLEHYRYCLNYQYGWFGEEDNEAIDMAISELQANATENSCDLISRADALKEMAQAECGVDYEYHCEVDNCTCSYIQRILDIPSAERVGVWIRQNDELKISDYQCSVCGHYQDDKTNYCGNCGAYMKGGTE